MAEAATRARDTLAFFKIVTADVERAEAFFTGAFAMERTNQVEGPTFREIMLTAPGGGFTLVLFQWRDGRALQSGSLHGPIGFITRDFDASLAQAIAHGATLDRGPFDYGGGQVAFLLGPEGHEIELMARAGKVAA